MYMNRRLSLTVALLILGAVFFFTFSSLVVDLKYFKSQAGQDQWIFKTFLDSNTFKNRLRGGFFVEFGARDGVEHSNSYFFERYLGWKGLLIEANPSEQKNIVKNRPGSAIVTGAICEKQGENVTLFDAGIEGWSGIKDNYDKKRLTERQSKGKEFQVPCYRLDYLIEYFNITDIDYMSVDTEGSELAALKTFPFHRLMPRIIGVEVLIGDGRGSIVQDKLIEFMQEKGYETYHIYAVARDTLDIFFVPRGKAFLEIYSSMAGKTTEFFAKRQACQAASICLK